MDRKKMFNFSLTIMSLLNGYAFVFMKGFSLAMLLTSYFAVVSAITVLRNRIPIKSPNVLMFVIYGMAATTISFLSTSYIDYGRVVFTLLKLVVWGSFVTFAGFLYFDYKIFLGYLQKVMLVTFFYLLIQYTAHFILGMDIPCSFNLGIISANYSNYEFTYSATNQIFRPGSFWTEPGYLGYYYNGFICMCLFDKDNVSKVIPKINMYIVMACLGVVMSMSTGAISIMIIIWFTYMALKNKKNIVFSLIVIAFFGIAAFCLIKLNWIEAFRGINKSLDNSIYKLQHLDNIGRIGGSFELLDYMPSFNKYLGFGIGNELAYTQSQYMNGIVTLIMWLGIIGLGVWFLLFASILKVHCKTIVQKMMLLLLLFDGVYSGLYFGAHSFIYLIVAFYTGNVFLEKNKSALPQNSNTNF